MKHALCTNKTFVIQGLKIKVKAWNIFLIGQNKSWF